MKLKKIAAASAVAALLTTAIPVTASARTFMEDGRFTAADVTAIIKDIVGLQKLTGDDFKKADLDGDGRITAKDATYVIKKIVGLPVDEPEEEGYVTIKGVKYDIATTTEFSCGIDDRFTNEDIKKVGKLKNLTKLSLYHDYSAIIADLSPLSGLTKLKDLDLMRCTVSDLTPLSTLPNLTHLTLGYGYKGDYKQIAKLKNLLWVGSPYDILDYDKVAWLQKQLPNCKFELWNQP